LWNLFSGGPSWDPFWNFIREPATSEDIKWTDKGRIPTLIGAGIILAPFAVPETGLYGAYAAHNAAVAAYCSAQYYGATAVGYALTQPAQTEEFITQLLNVPDGTWGVPNSYAGLLGWGIHFTTGIGFPDPERP